MTFLKEIYSQRTCGSRGLKASQRSDIRHGSSFTLLLVRKGHAVSGPTYAATYRTASANNAASPTLAGHKTLFCSLRRREVIDLSSAEELISRTKC
ncbi:hypothetical protein J6590_005948 [Homalodisca vitripennis]|nr:hypothetical protein J6590_005948 [Homalodisca vitripennis]